MRDIESLAREIRSQEDFQRFLWALLEDHRTNGRDWENSDLGSYLEALAGFVDDLEGYLRNRGEDVKKKEASWRLFAEILLAARVYE